MRRKFFLAVALCLLCLSAANAQVFLKVNETETKAVYENNQLLTSLALENSAAAMPARVRLEVLDALDNVIAASESTQKLARGRQNLAIPVAFSSPAGADDLLWKRLRYTVATEAGAGVTNVVSLSEIMPEVFELQISAPERIYAGMNLRAHVVALHPFTHKPIKGVELNGELKLELDTDADDDTIIVKAKGRTNDEGFASLDFKIPSNAKLDDDGDLTINGEKDGILRRTEEDLDYDPQAFVYLNTDKPIYQPAQKLYVRGLYLDALRRPLADRELSFEISDEEDETVYEGTLRTSRFGVANIEWQIPAEFKLGKYKIEVESDDDDVIGLAEFKVSRYDLPNFTVTAKTAKPFYLPQETKAEVTISAAYLFGRPVERGRVRIVEEKERRWNYSKQLYETDEGARVEGETDASGSFTAQIDLAAAQKALSEDNWKRFADVKFAAYFTDPTTNRTEQKRFDVRLTKESIHVYFIRQGDDPNPRLPFLFYISTFYADGTPARCEVKIDAGYRNTSLVTKLADARTNAYGAGKFEVRLPEKPFPEAGNELHFRVAADDRKGARGTLEDNLYTDENARQLRVRTDKTIYLPNEAANLKIFSSESEHNVFVDVLKNGSVVYSKNVRVRDARASLTIPPRADFKGELTIAAYYRDTEDADDVVALKTIFYPQAANFSVDLKSLKKVYRPNEEARVAFTVAGGEEKTREAALGVLVLDKAIEERARTEDLPDNFAMLRKLVGTADSFGSLTRRDLDRLDLAQPVTEDLQLAAEFLLAGKSFEPNFFRSNSFEDDFSRIYKDYFDKKLVNVEKILLENYEKKGEFPKDEAALRRILSAGGVDFGALRDAWEMPLETRFSTDRANTVLTFLTSGADKQSGTGDDFAVREMRFEWFKKTQNELNVILNNYRQQTENVPRTAEELRSIWRAAGVDFEALRDGWNRPLYLEKVEYDRDFLKVTPETVGNLDGERQLIMREKLVAQKVALFKIRSAGADGVRGVSDDFDLAAFTIVLEEKSLSPEKQTTVVSKSPIASAKGAIVGTIADPTGAVVPGATVKATNQSSKEVFTVRSNDEGSFLFANLPSGKYEVTAESPGFRRYSINNIVVSSMNLVRIEVTLDVGSVQETVSVTSDMELMVDASESKINTTKSESKSIAANFANNKNAPISTPRVREYFPETLLWQPELLTDKAGRAELKFKLGDNLTTWKMYAFASNEAGEVALEEKEFQTFQPFFAELDPPRVLTEGDRLALAVPVRNYTDKRQKVAVSLEANEWSRLAGGAEQSIEIAPNASQNAVFNLQAVAPVVDARQKVTALAARGEGDAIERKVSVRPNGRETVQTQSILFDKETAFDVDFPAGAFPKTRFAQIKIYPNMLAHVAESVEGLLKRPYGCGEQTTSSTYPNLMILRIEKDLQKSIEPRIKAQARAFLEDGYKRLLTYQTETGFGYWSGATPDTALTAYVLRFLTDAADFIEVDAARVRMAEKWLLSRQNPNGSWENNDVLTAYVLRSLTLAGNADEARSKSVAAGIDYLKNRLPELQDSYVVANLALAALKTGDAATAQNALEKLRGSAQSEKESLFWTTASTPFHGWGTPAKIETTALVVQAFLSAKDDNAEQISRGLSFLLKNKDRYGVWFSTQTTVNALDALIMLQKTRRAGERNGAEEGEIYVNGKKAQEFSIDGAGLKNPFIFDISSLLTADKNRIEIKTTGELNLTMAQAVAKHYVNWNESPADARYFELKVDFDKTQAKIGDEISCRVRAQRKFYRSGMAIAEIGLPPGADVDRAALEQAKRENRFSSYDVLPDKIVIYFPASSNGLDVEFKFRQRFGLDAQTAPFTVYDYYNEEASATLAPVRFEIK